MAKRIFKDEDEKYTRHWKKEKEELDKNIKELLIINATQKISIRILNDLNEGLEEKLKKRSMDLLIGIGWGILGTLALMIWIGVWFAKN